MNVFDILIERGFIQQTTHEEQIKELLEKEKVTFYTGFDPTADSLHIGHFIPIMAMSHMQRAGHRPIFVVGGGTGMVGDTTDRTDMRQMMTQETVQNNVKRFKEQLSKFIDFENDKAILINNADWLMELKYIPFIREYGVHFSVNKMLTADTYRTRFEKGLSFFEFNYMLMQAYDFLELNRRFDCRLQFGGNDQWSNIIAGVDLIRRVDNKEAFGMTFSLLTNSEGQKMGKTKDGAVWLDPEKTSPYEFYQFWLNCSDEDSKRYIRIFTLFSKEEIEKLEKEHDEAPHLRILQKALAKDMTINVHSLEDYEAAVNASEILFGKGTEATLAALPEKMFLSIFEGVPQVEIERNEIKNPISVVDFLTEKTNVFVSKGEARRMLADNGISINKMKIKDDYMVSETSLINDRYILVQKGKKNYYIIKIQ